jgi:hypothetical protein
MKKILYFLVTIVAVIGVSTQHVFATSASISASTSSSTVTTGNNVTITVRANSGTNPVDSAQATLNFDSSKVQYVSHAGGGVFTPVIQSSGGSSFSFSGAIFGGSTSGNQTMFSVTFKTVAAGTAGFSLSGVRVAYAGADLSISSSSGTSISIQNPVTSSPTPSPSPTSPSPAPTRSSSPTRTSNSTPSTTNDSPVTDTTPPNLLAKPEFKVSKSTIEISLETNEPSRVNVEFRTKGSEPYTKLSAAELLTKHTILLGKDEPLRAGQIYEIQLSYVDGLGNTSAVESYEYRTQGVEYTVKIVDKNGQPLANHPVTLFSDPISSTTDENGVAVFSDVSPGEHTVVFEIDGLTVRQPVLVADSLALLDADTVGEPEILELPFALVDTKPSESQFSTMQKLVFAALAGVSITLILQKLLKRENLNILWLQIRKLSNHPKPN